MGRSCEENIPLMEYSAAIKNYMEEDLVFQWKMQNLEIPYNTFATMGQNKDKYAQKSEEGWQNYVFLHLLFCVFKEDYKMLRFKKHLSWALANFSLISEEKKW